VPILSTAAKNLSGKNIYRPQGNIELAQAYRSAKTFGKPGKRLPDEAEGICAEPFEGIATGP
jgi:hypothetical protein